MQIIGKDLELRLRITTWVGSSVSYAKHYYGKIVYRGEHLTIERELMFTLKTKADVAELCNDEDDFRTYKIGDETSRFSSLEALRKEAIKVCKKLAPDAMLIENEYGPGYMLIGPNKKRLNAIHERLEAALERASEIELDEIENEWKAARAAA